MSSPLFRQPRLDSCRLASLIFESLFYGYFCATFTRCNLILWRRAMSRKESMFCMGVFVFGWSLFLTITGHLVVEIIQAFDALILPRNYLLNPLNAEGYSPAEVTYAFGRLPLNIAYAALYAISMFLADGFLIHRLYVIWRRDCFIIIPALLILGGLIGTSSMVMYLFGNSREIFGQARRWILASFALTFLCNVYCAAFIALKISQSQSRLCSSELSFTSRIEKISEILIQSAILYGLLVVLSLGFMTSDSNLIYFTIGVTCPIIGIIFSTVVTRTHDHIVLHSTDSLSISNRPSMRTVSSSPCHSPNSSTQNVFVPAFAPV